jgi:hypothetical protein
MSVVADLFALITQNKNAIKIPTWRRQQNVKKVLFGHISLDVKILMVLLYVASVENA